MPVMNGMGAQVFGVSVAPRPILGTARAPAPPRPIIGTARGLPVPLALAVQRAVVGTHASDNTVLGPVITGGGSGVPGAAPPPPVRVVLGPQLTGGGTGLPGQGTPVIVDHPTQGPIAVNVPSPVAQAIAAGDPNAAAAVNAAAGGSPGGAATPTGVSSSSVEGANVWGPRLFGLGILAAAGVLVLVVGARVK